MKTPDVPQNVPQTGSPESAAPQRVSVPAGPAGWYHTIGDDAPLYGPFASGDAAEEAGLHFHGHADFRVGQFRRREIDLDVFDAENVFLALEERNEEVVWPDCPPEWPQGEDAAELERRLAVTLMLFMKERGLFDQFRGLEPA